MTGAETWWVWGVWDRVLVAIVFLVCSLYIYHRLRELFGTRAVPPARNGGCGGCSHGNCAGGGGSRTAASSSCTRVAGEMKRVRRGRQPGQGTPLPPGKDEPAGSI
jgi:hypothetical protein